MQKYRSVFATVASAWALVMAIGVVGCGFGFGFGGEGDPPKRGAEVDGGDLAKSVSAAVVQERFVRFRTTTRVDGEVAVVDQAIRPRGGTDATGRSDGIPVRFVGDVAYSSMPEDLDGWVAHRIEGLPYDAEQVRSFRATAPRAFAAVLRAGRTTFVGSTERHGTRLRHYRTRVSAQRAVAMYLPTLGVDSVRADAGAKMLTYDTWLDPSHRPSRVRLQVPRGPGGSSPAPMETTFSRWGVPVKVVAPAAGGPAT